MKINSGTMNRNALPPEAERHFEDILRLESLRKELIQPKKGAATQRRIYASEWNLGGHSIADINQSISERQDSAASQMAEAMGADLETANRYIVENIPYSA